MTIIFIWESGIQTITKKLHLVFEIHYALKLSRTTLLGYLLESSRLRDAASLAINLFLVTVDSR